MKAKHTLLLIALGFCLDYAATLLRIFLRGGAPTLLVIAAIFKVAGVLLLVYKVITYPGFRKFMNH